jgi:hypothetical protein
MENNDDKKHFEIVVYGQRKPDQNAEKQTLLAICRMICGPAKTKNVPVQNNTELEDGNANQLGHGIFVRQKRFLLTVAQVAVSVASRGLLCYFLQV